MGSKHVSENDLIERFRKIHGDLYDYSNLDYINLTKKINITCNKHGVFLQDPKIHLKGGGCPKCYIENKTIPFSDILNRFIKVHGNLYCYDKVQYKNTSTKISIICSKHGIFKKTPSHHIMGHGCPSCVSGQLHSTEKTINDFIEIHGDRYDYSKVEYKYSGQKVAIECHKHGIFKQTVDNHKRGQGCPKCRSSKGEQKIRLFLDSIGIKYIEQYPICKNPKNDYNLRVDFYIPKIKSVIEYDGRQHFEPVNCFGGIKAFEELKERDQFKNYFCKKKSIKILRIDYKNFKNINSILDKFIEDTKI